MQRSLLVALAMVVVVLVAVMATGRGTPGLDDPGREEPSDQPHAHERPNADLEDPGATGPARTSDDRTEVAVDPEPVAEAHPLEVEARPWFPPGDEVLELFVRYADGKPARQIKLTLLPVGQELHMLGAPGAPLTSEDGRYRVEGVAAGRYHLLVHDLPAGTTRGEDYWADHPVPSPSPIELVLVEPAEIEGVVLDGAGERAQGMVEVHGVQASCLMGKASTRGDGTFSLRGLAPGRVLLRATTELTQSEAYEVDLAPGQILRGIELRLPPGGYVEVHVLDEAGRLARDYQVILIANDELVENEESDTEKPVVFGPLPAGSWSVVAVNENNGLQSILSGSVNVVAGETAVLELAPTTEGITVTGTLSRGGEVEVDEKLYFFREGEPLVEGVAMCHTDDEGRYEILIPAAGAYQVMEEGHGPMTFVERVIIPQAETFHHDVHLPGGQVSGRVIAEESIERPFRVTLEREDRDLDRILPDSGRGQNTDAKGFFHFEALRPGSYRLRLEGNGGLCAAPLTGILVGSHEHVQGLELHLRAGAGLQVLVRYPDGAVATGVYMQVRTAQGIPLFIEPRPSRTTVAFDSLPAEPLLVSAQHGDLAAVTTARPDLDRTTEVILTLQPAGYARVRAASGDEPVAAAFRIFTQAGDEVTDLVPRRDGENGFRDEVTSSKKRFGPLPPGRYTVTSAARDGR
ncbi:MAG: hypothetical protein O2816_12060, partial [Planctomycetota bacterium]|nr:hypothetical protein [Planctomycetota bacterium]